MTDAHKDIASITTEFGRGGSWGAPTAGETIKMADGSVWFHPFNGREPTRVA